MAHLKFQNIVTINVIDDAIMIWRQTHNKTVF